MISYKRAGKAHPGDGVRGTYFPPYEGRDLSFKEPFRIDTPVWYLARRSNLCERNGAMSLRVSNPCESAGERISLLKAAQRPQSPL